MVPSDGGTYYKYQGDLKFGINYITLLKKGVVL